MRHVFEQFFVSVGDSLAYSVRLVTSFTKQTRTISSTLASILEDPLVKLILVFILLWAIVILF